MQEGVIQESQLGFSSGYEVLLETLSSWGISLFTGVTGGGIVHLLKYLAPNSKGLEDTKQSRFFSIGEYVAGYIPLGYSIVTRKMAAGIATTGAATKLLSCGLSDAKLHDIPAVYLVPLSVGTFEGCSSLQDTTRHGSNIIQQLAAELPQSVFLLDDLQLLKEQLSRAKALLDDCTPVVLVFSHETLSQPLPAWEKNEIDSHVYVEGVLKDFFSLFRQRVRGRRLIIFVGEELERYPNAVQLTDRLCSVLGAPVVWSINGANAISRDNPYGYGYISFGGNDHALALWNSLCEEDVLLAIGVCPDEYTVNLKPIVAGHSFFLTNLANSYGKINGSLRHFVRGEYYQVNAPLDAALETLIQCAEADPMCNITVPHAPENLNTAILAEPRIGYVDMVKLYQLLDSWWKPDSIGFDDVCLSYKDRQYVTQRPNGNIKFYSLYRGSAMGGAFGAAIGAKLGCPEKRVYLFTGDGCFRLFAGCLSEASQLGLVVFLINNERYSIVEQGLNKIMPDVPSERYHVDLRPIDFCAIAIASGWDAYSLQPDLTNVDEILQKTMGALARSVLINVPVDPQQELGKNPRISNL